MSDRNNRMDSGDNRGYQKEVDSLLKRRATDSRVVATLQAKYNDSKKVDAIYDMYVEAKKKTEKRARKFLAVLTERYHNLTPIQIYDKAIKYKNKVEMSDAEFEVFRHLVFSQNKQASQFTYNVPNTRIAQLFGYSVEVASLNNELNVSAKEEGVVQEILRLNAENRSLHNQVIEQSFSYSGFDLQALHGSYNADLQNVFNYVHPVLAALFIPRIELLEQHMLHASISNIVRLKHEGKPIVTRPEYTLLWDMMTDPNDAVCNIESPIKDIHNRALLQVNLWKNVLNLRQGKFYHGDMTSFLTAIENCRVNMFDTPDLAMSRDEGVIFRRLMSAFSLRPTLVQTTPFSVDSSLTANAYLPLPNNPSLTMFTSLPMIAVRIPNNQQGAVQPISFSDALSQTQWYVENKKFVQKSQSVMKSTNMIVFYVPRRHQKVDYLRRLYPHKFNSLPTHIVGTTHVNQTPIDLEQNLSIGTGARETFALTSVVCVDSIAVGDDKQRGTIVGCFTMLRTEIDNRTTNLIYEPSKAGVVQPDGQRKAPIYVLEDNFEEIASKVGTIFVYVSKENKFNPLDA